jgi:hypothetical protein
MDDSNKKSGKKNKDKTRLLSPKSMSPASNRESENMNAREDLRDRVKSEKVDKLILPKYLYEGLSGAKLNDVSKI